MFVLPAQSPKWRPIKQSKDRVTLAPIMALLVCVIVVVEVFVKLLRSIFTLLVGSKNNVCRCFFTSCLNKCPYQGHQLTITSKTLKQKLLKLNLYYLKSVIIFHCLFKITMQYMQNISFDRQGCWCIRLLSLLFFRYSLQLTLYFMYSTKYYLNNQNKHFIFAVGRSSWKVSKNLKCYVRFSFLVDSTCWIYDSNCAAMTQKFLLKNVSYSWFFEK